ncbi:hypothetical protein [Cetobacterium sp. ZOR0034]|uniref:hypothetical protein n=1 Tax=Cetobacterium sp. ZOR0034 TaxID=1339239 RepID=UPI0006458D37|nr:hypothetical protein [Cetobacterium sp. ZOR0034]
MKKTLVWIFLFLTSYTFSLDVVGKVYNLEKRGTGYRGALDAKVGNNKGDFRVKLIPLNDVEIVRVNGSKDENNIYEIKGSKLKVDFIYKGKIASLNEKVVLGRLEYLDEAKKSEMLIGDIAVEFRKLGKIDMSIKGDMDFGIISAKVPSGGIRSKKNPEITVDLDIDKRDVKNTKMYVQYPKEIVMANGQLIVSLESLNKGIYVERVKEKGNEVERVSFIPTKEKVKEKIKLEGVIHSTVPTVSSGSYSESVKVKAFYEYLDYSIEKKSTDRAVIVRR